MASMADHVGKANAQREEDAAGETNSANLTGLAGLAGIADNDGSTNAEQVRHGLVG